MVFRYPSCDWPSYQWHPPMRSPDLTVLDMFQECCGVPRCLSLNQHCYMLLMCVCSKDRFKGSICKVKRCFDFIQQHVGGLVGLSLYIPWVRSVFITRKACMYIYKRFTVPQQYNKEQLYIIIGESVHKWIENVNNLLTKQNIFIPYHNIFTRYLAMTKYNKTFNLIDFKSEINSILSPPSWLFAFSSILPTLCLYT